MLLSLIIQLPYNRHVTIIKCQCMLISCVLVISKFQASTKYCLADNFKKTPAECLRLKHIFNFGIWGQRRWYIGIMFLKVLVLLLNRFKHNQNYYLKLVVLTSMRGLHQKKLVLSSSGSWHDGKTPCRESGCICGSVGEVLMKASDRGRNIKI